MTHNKSGLALYKKRGFTVEGETIHALYIDGKFVDEYLMAKLILQKTAAKIGAK